ncbi:MAG: hypothetical protein HND48_01840 [Chloroflexi bacterium]|nr:hypothetical protein [Chloroflexota bacterium]
MHIRHILPEPEQGVLPLDPLNGALTGLLSVAFNLALLQAAPAIGSRSSPRPRTAVRIAQMSKASRSAGFRCGTARASHATTCACSCRC